MTPVVRLVREGRAILREIRLARPEDQALALAGRIVKWYGEFELRRAEVAPDVFAEFRRPGIPSGYLTEKGEVVRTPITLETPRENVKGDLATLRKIEIRLTGSVTRVKLLRAPARASALQA